MSIHCAHCEEECASDAETCPNCGHRLAAASKRDTGQLRSFGSWMFGGEGGRAAARARRNIEGLRILGLIEIVIGLWSLAAAVNASAWNDPASVYWLTAGGAIWLGIMTRALAGIWATLERIAEKK